MKKLIPTFCILFLAVLMTVSCSKDNDPVDDNLFVGTYNGSISYVEQESSTTISTAEGRVTLVKVGDTYNFDFSDGVPSLTGIRMEKNQNVLANADGTLIIGEGRLFMAYTKDGGKWGADCTR